jgi:hypothetical protein
MNALNSTAPLFKQIPYKTIADVSCGSDRVCIYMKFDLATSNLLFACKQSVNNERTSIKDVSFIDSLAWLGFNDLSAALYSDATFSKRYKSEIHQIYPNQLNVVIINDVPYFFYKLDDTWSTTEYLNQITGYFGDSLRVDIENVIGPKFLKKYDDIIKETMTLSLLQSEYEQQMQELIDKQNSTSENGETPKTEPK